MLFRSLSEKFLRQLLLYELFQTEPSARNFLEREIHSKDEIVWGNFQGGKILRGRSFPYRNFYGQDFPWTGRRISCDSLKNDQKSNIKIQVFSTESKE